MIFVLMLFLIVLHVLVHSSSKEGVVQLIKLLIVVLSVLLLAMPYELLFLLHNSWNIGDYLWLVLNDLFHLLFEILFIVPNLWKGPYLHVFIFAACYQLLLIVQPLHLGDRTSRMSLKYENGMTIPR